MRYRVCSRPGCPNLSPRPGRCDDCNRAADNTRQSGTKSYNQPRHRAFRRAVLNRDPVCRCTGCTGHEGPCVVTATVADHWPLSHAELLAAGRDAYDPEAGRGLCASCHNRYTAAETGGWGKAR